MLEKILHTIRKKGLVLPESRIVVAVSGGADSLALLHILNRLAPTLNIQLHVATFNHRLRGEVSADDARFVQQTAQTWGIPVTMGEADVAALGRRQKISTEAAARLARYNFLADVAKQVGAERIAVAHHADDQAETVLLHLLRGAGVTGLGGMAAKAPLHGHPDLILIRPLLDITRAEIEAYCRDNNLHPREDATNTDISYLRNRLRHETLPYLQQLNPRIASVLTQLADIATVENDFMEAEVQRIKHSGAARVTAGRAYIKRETFNALHPALQRRLITWATEQVAGSRQDIEFVHIIAAVEVAQRGRLGAVAELPDGLRLRVDYENLVVEPSTLPLPETNQPLLIEGAEIAVNIPGITPITSHWALVTAIATPDDMPPLHSMSGGKVSFTPLPKEEELGVRAVARLDIPENSIVLLRTRREGDRFAPLGLEGHTQKVSRWMVNRKIPQHVRDRLPLLVVNGAIAAIFDGKKWIIADQYAIRNADQHIIYFHFQQIL